MNSDRLILGTRGSELALRQTEIVTAALRRAHPGLVVERRIIATTGDKRTDLRFREFTEGGRLDKGIFTRELEAALAAGEIDAAVHSLKDVPTILDPDFAIAATPPRAPVEDALVSRDGFTLDSLPSRARVGTSSVRRQRQLGWLRPGTDGVEIRGNVPTRIAKLLREPPLDAVLLARAGLHRLGLLRADGSLELDDATFRCEILPASRFLPAAGQGAIGIEIRRPNERVHALLQAVNDPETFARTTAEREFLRRLRAGCQTPIGILSRIEDGALHLDVRVFSESEPDRPPFEAASSAPASHPEQAAATLASAVPPGLVPNPS